VRLLEFRLVPFAIQGVIMRVKCNRFFTNRCVGLVGSVNVFDLLRVEFQQRPRVLVFLSGINTGPRSPTSMENSGANNFLGKTKITCSLIPNSPMNCHEWRDKRPLRMTLLFRYVLFLLEPAQFCPLTGGIKNQELTNPERMFCSSTKCNPGVALSRAIEL
jgi:hypothetical protein